MIRYLLLCSLFMISNLVYAEGAKTVWVDSYTRSDGTYVSGHWRSPPSDSSASAGYYPTSSSTNTYYEYEIQIWNNGIEFLGNGYDGFPISK